MNFGGVFRDELNKLENFVPDDPLRQLKNTCKTWTESELTSETEQGLKMHNLMVTNLINKNNLT